MGIGATESLILLLLAAVVGLPVVGLLVLLSRRKAAAGSGSGGAPASRGLAPVSTDTLYFLRFDPDQEAMIRAQVQSLAPGGRLSGAADIRDAAMDLGRAVEDATHAWVGPSPGPTLDRPRSPVGGGIIVALRAHTRVPLDTVADDADAEAVAASLRKLMSLSDADVRGGTLHVVEAGGDPRSPMLAPLRAATRPGQRPCTHCGRPYPRYETLCPYCGAASPS